MSCWGEDFGIFGASKHCWGSFLFCPAVPHYICNWTLGQIGHDNLEWVDSADARYQAYIQQRLKDRWKVYYLENNGQRPTHDKYVAEGADIIPVLVVK